MIYFRPTFDDNRSKSRVLTLAVHGWHWILCSVIKITPWIRDIMCYSHNHCKSFWLCTL